MKIKVMILSLSVILGAFLASGEGLSLYSSLTSAGVTTGGLRYDLGTGWVIDGTVGIIDDGIGKDTGNLIALFADIYYGNWGLAVSYLEEAGSDHNLATSKTTSISLMYAIEQAINDKISLGIAVPLITMQSSSDEDIDYALELIKGWDIYAVLAF